MPLVCQVGARWLGARCCCYCGNRSGVNGVTFVYSILTMLRTKAVGAGKEKDTGPGCPSHPCSLGQKLMENWTWKRRRGGRV